MDNSDTLRLPIRDISQMFAMYTIYFINKIETYIYIFVINKGFISVPMK